MFSPSINVDYQTWEPVKKYLDKEINNGDKDEIFYSTIRTKKDYLI